MTKVTLENTGVSHTKRIVREGTVIAMALEYSTGRWGAYDSRSDKRMTGLTFKTANAVRIWVEAQSEKEPA